MLAFTLRRLVQAIPVVFLSTVGVFLLLHLVPGDPAVALAGSDATPEVLHAMRRELGLDQPLPVQYGLWVGRVIQGDLGRSYASKLPVGEQIAQRIPATLELTIAGLLLALLISIPTGILAAVRERGPADWLVSSFNAFAIAVPNFWFGILMILLFGLALGWLPPSGRGDFGRDPVGALQFLLLPAVTLALNQSAILSRFVKSSMLEVMHEDFVRTARAKGLREWLVVQRHVLRNALVPVATVLGIQFGRLLGGAIVVESVFAWPGVGRLILQGIGNRDYTIVQGTLLLLVVTFVVVNLITDLAYGLLDPRIRLSRGGVGR
jgi:ABC-type dipeptide/oligopeptide/nickel transport system permease component